MMLADTVLTLLHPHAIWVPMLEQLWQTVIWLARFGPTVVCKVYSANEALLMIQYTTSGSLGTCVHLPTLDQKNRVEAACPRMRLISGSCRPSILSSALSLTL